MTKKDFELIARVLASVKSQAAAKVWSSPHAAVTALCGDMADALASTNPRFDRVRFLAACEGRTRKSQGEYVHA